MSRKNCNGYFIQFVILIVFSQVLLSFSIEISSYARVSRNGNAQEEKVKTNQLDGIRRQTVNPGNSTLIEKIANSQQNEHSNGKSTGRAIQNNYQFPLASLFSKPKRVGNNNENNKMPRYMMVYPSNTQYNMNNIEQVNRKSDTGSSTGGPVAQDRFAPGEAYHATIYKLRKQKKEQAQGYNYSPPGNANPDLGPVTSSPVPQQPVIVPQSSTDDSSASQGYLYNFPPNINSTYLPPDDTQPKSPTTSYLPPASGDVEPSEPQHDHHHDHYLPPSAATDDADSMGMNPPAPSGPSFDHHHDYHQYPPSSFGHSGIDYFPEVIYDHDDHDHHHFHHDHPVEITNPPPTTEASTTIKALETTGNQPRAKTYSYYYLGRKVWYIPLFFTLYFCIYVTALIIRSVGRHKVEYPNHYQRSLTELSNRELMAKVNRVTIFTMKQIDDFAMKYL